MLANLCLAIFAKSKATPWAIQQMEQKRREYIIVIGSSSIQVNNTFRNLIGFATVFNAAGKYLVGDCSTITAPQNYSKDLKKYLFNLINELISSESIDKTDEIRLVFHLYKPAGRKNEILAITNVLDKFKDFKIEYAILHIDQEHELRIFANQGKVLPSRGLVVKISNYARLLCFTSSNLTKGNPSPLLLSLDRRSTFHDIDYLATQSFYFYQTKVLCHQKHQ